MLMSKDNYFISRQMSLMMYFCNLHARNALNLT